MAIFPNTARCRNCGVPLGYIVDPNDSTVSTYIPIAPIAAMARRMVSSYTAPVIPDEVAEMGWSWGAFGCNWIWLCNHNMVGVGLAVLFGYLLLPPLSLIISIYLGFTGNRLAWQFRKFDSVEQFKQCQRRWTPWGIIATLFMLVAGLAVVGLIITAS